MFIWTFNIPFLPVYYRYVNLSRNSTKALKAASVSLSSSDNAEGDKGESTSAYVLCIYLFPFFFFKSWRCQWLT